MRTEEDNTLLDECERLKAELDAIPQWRVLKRYHATNAWLTACAVLQHEEQARIRKDSEWRAT